MDNRNVILLLGFFESSPNVDIHELIIIAVSSPAPCAESTKIHFRFFLAYRYGSG